LDIAVQRPPFFRAVQSGANKKPAVVNGEFEFGFSNVTSLLLAVNNGVPLQAVSSGLFVAENEPDIGGIAVPAGSDIASPKDLAGKTVSVNTLNNIGDSTVRFVVEQDGGDPSAVEFVEMGFPDMPAALAAGQIDAMWASEPHLSRAVAQGAEVISWNFSETDPDLMVAAYFSTTQYVAENPEIVEAFTAGLKKAFAFADANPDAVREAIASYTDIDPEILASMGLPRFDLPFSEHTVSLLADLALKYGLVTAPIDYASLLP